MGIQIHLHVSNLSNTTYSLYQSIMIPLSQTDIYRRDSKPKVSLNPFWIM